MLFAKWEPFCLGLHVPNARLEYSRPNMGDILTGISYRSQILVSYESAEKNMKSYTSEIWHIMTS